MDSVTELSTLGSLPVDAVPASAKTRVKSTIAGTVVTMTDGVATATFDFASLPTEVASAIAVIGLRDLLIRSDDPSAAFAKLMGGAVPGRKPAKEKPTTKPRELSAWRQAWAHAAAEKAVKDAGGKTYIGKNMTPEMKLELDNAMQRAVGLHGATLAKAKLNSVIVGHWERLTGAKPADLF